MCHCHHDNCSIFRNNLEIIKMLLELWRDRLQAPTKYGAWLRGCVWSMGIIHVYENATIDVCIG